MTSNPFSISRPGYSYRDTAPRVQHFSAFHYLQQGIHSQWFCLCLHYFSMEVIFECGESSPVQALASQSHCSCDGCVPELSQRAHLVHDASCLGLFPGVALAQDNAAPHFLLRKKGPGIFSLGPIRYYIHAKMLTVKYTR